MTESISEMERQEQEVKMATEQIVIIINGRKFGFVAHRALSYRDIADLAGFKSPVLPSMTCRVRGREGRIVAPGDSVTPVEGLVINVTDTSNA